MTISTYTELKTEVAGFAHRTDLTSKMDTFCLLAEGVMNKDLRVLEMEKNDTITFDAAFEDLPTDYLELRSFNVEINGARRTIPIVSKQILDQRYSNVTGTQSAACIHGGQIELRPTASVSDTVTGNLSYFARITTLTGTSTNDILTYYPMVYLSAMMIQVYLYLQDDDEMSKWASAYNSQVEQANKTAQGGRYLLPKVEVA